MSHTPTTGVVRRARRAMLALLVMLLCSGATGVATSLASNRGGADRSRPATFGDCKNHNGGLHNGYDCEAEAEETPGEPPAGMSG